TGLPELTADVNRDLKAGERRAVFFQHLNHIAADLSESAGCFVSEASRAKAPILRDDGLWQIETENGHRLVARNVVLATGQVGEGGSQNRCVTKVASEWMSNGHCSVKGIKKARSSHRNVILHQLPTAHYKGGSPGMSRIDGLVFDPFKQLNHVVHLYALIFETGFLPRYTKLAYLRCDCAENIAIRGNLTRSERPSEPIHRNA
ncbi:MAG: hypothetical protein AAFQ15_15460, partial [Pseudomonadota bacterium]